MQRGRTRDLFFMIGETMILDDTENTRVMYVYDALGREIERKTVSEKAPAAGGPRFVTARRAERCVTAMEL